jgi:DNA-directed RNA polymerase specialized sigma24 family protein
MSALATNEFEEDPNRFDARFGRSYQMLHFIARRILGDPQRAAKAVQNCRITASRNSPRFEYAGAFKSWLFKVLIDEALALLRENQQTHQPKVSREPVPAKIS